MRPMNKSIEEYLEHGTERENSNENFSHSGMQAHIAGRIIAEDYINASPLRLLHEERLVHIHDAKEGRFCPYCNGGDISKLLTLGLANPAGSSSKPAKHFDTAMSHIENMLSISQQEFAGAQAFSNVDTYLSPFIYYDDLDYETVHQAWQRFIFGINYPKRSGYQTIFANLSFDLQCPDHLRDEHVIRGGETQLETYGDFTEEIDMFNMAFLDVMMKGDADGHPFTFPIPTYSIDENTDWHSPVTNRIFDLTAKFGSPYFSNHIGTGFKASDSRSMCCRLSLNLKEIEELFDSSSHGIWDIGSSTGSIAVTTINMAQVGYQCNHVTDKEAAVINMLNNWILPSIKEHHVWKRGNVEYALRNGLLPFTQNYLCNFNTYFSTVCTVGMNECCLNLFNKPIHECTSFVENVLAYLRSTLREWSIETGFLWNLEEAPAEGISYSLALHDKKKFPDCNVQGSGDGVYYTNSSHCAVDSGLSPIDEIKCQEKFKSLYNGGTLHHLFIGEASPDPGGVKDLLHNLCKNTTLPYIAFTRSYAICKNCGMTDDLSGVCPKCNAHTEVFSRVTGYIRPVHKYNNGKKAEFAARTQHITADITR